MTTNIAVSVLTTTYCRTRDLNELVFSFLKQTFQGDRELIILNDRTDQTIHYDHSLIKIINVKDRFKTLGDKRNYLLDQAQYNYITSWDDDDIYLPDFLQKYSDAIGDKPIVKGVYVWWDTSQNEQLQIAQISGMNNLLAKKKLLYDHGKYEAINTSEDVRLLRKLMKAGHLNMKKAVLWGKPQFIQRRRATEVGFNITSTGIENDTSSTSLDYVKEAADNLVKGGKEPTGDIELNPDWYKDYVEWTEKELERLKPNLEHR